MLWAFNLHKTQIIINVNLFSTKSLLRGLSEWDRIADESSWLNAQLVLPWCEYCSDWLLTADCVFLLQETNEIVAIKKFKDSEGKRCFWSEYIFDCYS